MTPSLAGPIPVPPCLPPAASHPLPTLLAGLSLGWAGRKVPFFRGCSVFLSFFPCLAYFTVSGIMRSRFIRVVASGKPPF